MVLLIRRAQALMEAAGMMGTSTLSASSSTAIRPPCGTCFTLENFDNLIKNGRMRPIVGTLLRSLGIHIIADATAEGTIHVADKARGVGKTYRAITALMKASKDCTDAEVVISHCENLEGAMALKRQILADLPVKQVDLLSCRGLTSFYAMEKGLTWGTEVRPSPSGASAEGRFRNSSQPPEPPSSGIWIWQKSAHGKPCALCFFYPSSTPATRNARASSKNQSISFHTYFTQRS